MRARDERRCQRLTILFREPIDLVYSNYGLKMIVLRRPRGEIRVLDQAPTCRTRPKGSIDGAVLKTHSALNTLMRSTAYSHNGD